MMTEISPFGIRRAAFIHATPNRIWEEFKHRFGAKLDRQSCN